MADPTTINRCNQGLKAVSLSFRPCNAMTDSSLRKVIAETFFFGSVYILTSACLLSFNKYFMKGGFPYAKVFTTIHMIVATLLSLLLYKLAPSLYPSMGKARANWKAVLKFMVPLGCLFALNLYLSNKALQYCSLSFVQFCKEGNVALMFALACLVGLQAFTWYKARRPKRQKSHAASKRMQTCCFLHPHLNTI